MHPAKPNDIDIELDKDEIITLYKIVEKPKDYVERSRENAIKDSTEYQAAKDKKNRIWIGIVLGIVFFIAIAAVSIFKNL